MPPSGRIHAARGLERRLGVQLFVRTVRGARLTPDGRHSRPQQDNPSPV
ncbi:helix-turn-helix domain-containing protein [Streptomyces sp. NPDC002911]